MSTPVILALDQGTTSSRALVIDRDCNVLAAAANPVTQIFPQPGWVEHDPRELVSTTISAAHRALAQAQAAAGDVVAIGITNQRETTILWDRATGEPIANAIVWQDRRTADRCAELRSHGVEELARKRTGLVLDPYFSATKIAWLLDATPGLRERAKLGEIAFGTVDSWLIWNLTAGARHQTDVTNASRTMLYDIGRMRWDDELLRAFDIPRELLPTVHPCIADYGTTDVTIFGQAIPIAGVAGDQHAALFGQACFDRGQTKSTYGTGSFVMMNTGERLVRSDRGILSTIAYALDPSDVVYALEGSIFSTGSTVEWLRDNLGMIAEPGEIESLARGVLDSAGVSVVPAFTGLGSPYWDPHARGAILGLSLGSSRGHIARAVIDAMTLQTVDVVIAMCDASGIELEELRVDGGASANSLAMQLQSDYLGVPVARPDNVESTALGAAYFAGLGRGYWPDIDALRARERSVMRWHPRRPPHYRETALAAWHEAVARTRGNR